MGSKLITSYISFVAIMPVLTGCLASLPTNNPQADAPVPSRIERVQLGDNQLTCVQIKAQYEDTGRIVGALDQKRGNGYAGAAATGAGATAALGAAGRIGPSMIPYLGHAIQATTAIMGQQMQNELTSQTTGQQRIQEAQARREHLMGLYEKKGCK